MRSSKTKQNDFPKNDLPPMIVHYFFDLMVSMGVFCFIISSSKTNKDKEVNRRNQYKTFFKKENFEKLLKIYWERGLRLKNGFRRERKP